MHDICHKEKNQINIKQHDMFYIRIFFIFIVMGVCSNEPSEI